MNDPPKTSFDVLTQPWIPVRRINGTTDELSVLQTFRQAPTVRSIGGELPTTTFTLIRFLLAILHRAFVVDAPPTVVWGNLWQAPELPVEAIEQYLQQHADRFDLLNSDKPFFQVASLRSTGGGISGLEKVIADVPNGTQFFTTRAGAALESIPFAEATRWLLHVNAFDTSGIKSGAIGDRRVKGGKGYPIGTSWTGCIGGIILEGHTLRETLLLNLVLGDPQHGFATLSGDDLPVWERPPLTAGVETRGSLPREAPEGPADLYTWPSRRIRLVHDGRAVTGVILAIGDPLRPQNQFIEPMTTWRRSETQEKKLGRSLVYMPLRHDPERSMWRGLAALIPHGVREQQRRDGVSAYSAGNVEWIHRLQESDSLGGPWLPLDLVLRTRAVGIDYGSKESSVAEIIDDSLTVHAVLFAPGGSELAARAVSAVKATDLAVTALAILAGHLEVAAGGDETAAQDKARQDAYFTLDAPFRRWLSELDSTTDALDALFGWYGTARNLLRVEGQRLVEAAGPAAWVGRNNRSGRHIDTALADAWFRSALVRALPYRERSGEKGLPDSAPVISGKEPL